MMRLGMNKSGPLLVAVAVLLGGLLPAPTDVHAGEHDTSIGTGGLTGVYYPAGSAICKFLNEARTEHGTRCFTESTAGSVYNLQAIRNGNLDFGIVQSDWVHHAKQGTSRFQQDGPFEKLRMVFALHAEPFTLVVRDGAGIDSFADLKGKRVNIGNPGSGQRGTMDVVMAAYGITPQDFAEVHELGSDDMAHAMCNDELDAMVYTVGHPAAAIKEVTQNCDVTLVDVSGPKIDKLIAENPYYRRSVILGGTYEGTSSDTVTFGVQAVLVTSADVSEDKVYAVTRQTLANLKELRRLHDAFANLEMSAMVNDEGLAPLHQGVNKVLMNAPSDF